MADEKHTAPYAIGMKVCSVSWIGGKNNVEHECVLHPDHVDGREPHRCRCGAPHSVFNTEINGDDR